MKGLKGLRGLKGLKGLKEAFEIEYLKRKMEYSTFNIQYSTFNFQPLGRVMALFILLLVAMAAKSQNSHKLSNLVRKAVATHTMSKLRCKGDVAMKDSRQHSNASITAFVRIDGDGECVLAENGCRSLAQFGNIYIAEIPISKIGTLAECALVERIEAGASCSVSMNETPGFVNASQVYEGVSLPQAYTGKGVVMGIMDIGFDLTHPNFYSPDMKSYRIMRLWDQLALSDTESELPVGKEYTTEEQLLSQRHTRDGEKQTHGTHTLGIAAGGGYTTDYRGMAWESDICLVANATTEDEEFIAEEDKYKYTSATDALGFKYILDYAQSVGKPCVISFSEGSMQDIYGDDQLYYELLDSLTGPGRIIVASAGNMGWKKTYFRKPVGKERMGTFLLSPDKTSYSIMQANGPFVMRTIIYGEKNDTIDIPSDLPFNSPDSLYTDTVTVSSGVYVFQTAGYTSCYDSERQAYEFAITSPREIWGTPKISFQIVGEDADVEYYMIHGVMTEDDTDSTLDAGETTHNIHSPSSAPCVVSVGSSAYRNSIVNVEGRTMTYDCGTDGVYASFSSVGPTVDGRVKPDVIAPGVNVVSSYNSFYYENNPESHTRDYCVELVEYGGRNYPWTADSGTSMSSPVVGGAIALWLQAYPHLTPSQVMDIIKHTARTTTNVDLPVPNNYEGYGEIDVYKGLLEVLKLKSANIDMLSPYNPKDMTFTVKDGSLDMLFHEQLQSDIVITVYSIDGRKVLTGKALAGNMMFSMDISSLPKDVYAVQLTSADRKYGGSTLIRIGD